jgi:hypothetical protein
MFLSDAFQQISKVPSLQQQEMLENGKNHNKIPKAIGHAINNPNISDEALFSMVTRGGFQNDPVPQKSTPVHGNYYQDRYEDYFASRAEPIPTINQSNHGMSRRPDTGEILKTPDHESFHLAVMGERQGNYKFYYRQDPVSNRTALHGRVYSFNTEEFQKKNPEEWQAVPEVTVDEWRWKPYNLEATMDHVIKYETYTPLTHTGNHYNPEDGLFYAFPDKDGTSIGIGHRLSGEARNYSKRLLQTIAPHKDVDDLIAGRMGLTEDEVLAFFEHDMRDHIRRTERQFPLLYLESDYMKRVLIDGNYNTFFRDTHTTTKQINLAQEAMQRKDYSAALAHYKIANDNVLDRGDYREQLEKNPTVQPGGLLERFQHYKNAIEDRIREVEGLLKPTPKQAGRSNA